MKHMNLAWSSALLVSLAACGEPLSLPPENEDRPAASVVEAPAKDAKENAFEVGRRAVFAGGIDFFPDAGAFDGATFAIVGKKGEGSSLAFCTTSGCRTFALGQDVTASVAIDEGRALVVGERVDGTLSAWSCPFTAISIDGCIYAVAATQGASPSVAARDGRIVVAFQDRSALGRLAALECTSTFACTRRVVSLVNGDGYPSSLPHAALDASGRLLVAYRAQGANLHALRCAADWSGTCSDEGILPGEDVVSRAFVTGADAPSFATFRTNESALEALFLPPSLAPSSLARMTVSHAAVTDFWAADAGSVPLIAAIDADGGMTLHACPAAGCFLVGEEKGTAKIVLASAPNAPEGSYAYAALRKTGTVDVILSEKGN